MKFSGNALRTLNPRIFFLFNDSIMWTTNEASPKVKGHLDLVDAELRDLEGSEKEPEKKTNLMGTLGRARGKSQGGDNDALSFQLTFKGEDKNREVKLVAPSPSAKAEWMADIKSSITK